MLRFVAVGAALRVSISSVWVLSPMASPRPLLNTAVIVCEPVESDELVKLASPAAFTAFGVPTFTPSTLN